MTVCTPASGPDFAHAVGVNSSVISWPVNDPKKRNVPAPGVSDCIGREAEIVTHTSAVGRAAR